MAAKAASSESVLSDVAPSSFSEWTAYARSRASLRAPRFSMPSSSSSSSSGLLGAGAHAATSVAPQTAAVECLPESTSPATLENGFAWAPAPTECLEAVAASVSQRDDGHEHDA